MATLVPADLLAQTRAFGAANRRFAALGLIIGGLAVLWVASKWMTGPTYVTLYHDIELSAMSGMTESLTKGGIAYRLESGGSEILVPVQDVARARVLLAKDGMPMSGRPGMELFDKPTWGMTDFTQRVTYRRALEGELSRTIGSLEGVQRAEVHLALPEDSPLRRLNRPAEAAVVVSLRPGGMLTPGVVQGISYIVSNSVEGLPAQNVAVIDAAGRLLSSPVDTGTSGLSSRQLDMQRATEKELGDKINGLVATVLGPGHSRVQIAAKMDFDQTERTTETYDPDGQVLNTEQRSEATGDQTEAGSGNQTVISNTYANTKKVERTIGSTGTINKLTVAVFVDEKALAKSAATPAKADSTLKSFNAAIRNAIGLDTARGDRLTLATMPFEIDPLAITKLPADSAPKRDVLVVVERFSRPVIMLIGIALAFVLALKLMAAAPGSPGSAPGALASGSAELATPVAPIVMADATHRLKAGVRNHMSEEPAQAAQVVRAWIGESR